MKTIDKIQSALIGQLIVSALGALLLLVDDFAGFYHQNYYLHVETWGYIYLGSGFLSSVLILIAAGGLLLCAYNSAKTLKEGDDAKKSDILRRMKMSIVGSLTAAGLAFIGGLVFVITNLVDQTEEWWLESGFYGALIGGLLVAYFCKLVLDKIEK